MKRTKIPLQESVVYCIVVPYLALSSEQRVTISDHCNLFQQTALGERHERIDRK